MMNWKLIFQLSLFGLFMAIATVYFIPSNIEPFCWLAIFLFCAWAIGRATTTAGARFVNGLCLGLANCVWITGAHVLLVSTYLANHERESKMLAASALGRHPRLMMAISGPIIGIISGCVIGVLAIIAGKLVKSGAAEPRAMGQGA